MEAPSLSLKFYTFKYDTVGFTTPVTFGGADGHVRSVELEAVNGQATDFYLTYEDGEVLLNFPTIPLVRGNLYRKIPLRFIVGYTEYDGDKYDEDDVIYNRVDVNVYVTRYDYGDPKITYVENLATRVGEPAWIVVHGENLTDGLSVKIVDGEEEHVVPPEDIKFDIDSDGKGTASFAIVSDMLAANADGSEPCATYVLLFSYGDQNYGDVYNRSSLIRYKYDSETDEQQRYSTEDVTIEKRCYITGEMSLVYDTEDENGNAVLHPESDPKLGNDIYLRMNGRSCEDYIYTMVRVKYNKNLMSKSGELTLNGVKLRSGDVVWLSHQLVESENGLWVVNQGNWEGYNPLTYDPSSKLIANCHVDCIERQEPYPVDSSSLIDLGAKASYPVDYVCRDDVPYKCGSQTICSYLVRPGHVVALLNQSDDENGIYRVTCGAWEKIFDIDKYMVDGTTIDFTSDIVVQNDIDFCQCGGVFHIDYFWLTPTCYLHHLRRTVKIMCGGASIAPNAVGSQFKITDYQIRMGEEDSLIGNCGRTPGDPVKETCMVENDDIDFAYGLTLVEHRQYIEDPQCIVSPMCSSVCDIPRVYNLRMTQDYTSSNDQNGFTIKFWRYETNSWHLYAYIGSGTQQIGMDYYVYHLHVKGKAAEQLVDVNEHDWFNVTTGVIASGSGADSFGICDDTWEQHNLSDYTLYKPWRIKCTTNLLAHCYDDPQSPHVLRTTCKDMETGWKTTAAIGDEDSIGYLRGMPHLFGVAYYTTAISKSQFVAEYNKANPECIYPVVEVLATDEDTVDGSGNKAGNYGISTDSEQVLRR